MDVLTLLASPAPVRVGWRTRTAPAWDFDVPAIMRAARELGVSSPVEVGCVEWTRKRWDGLAAFDEGVHSIRVRRAADADEASRTLWHELTHAAQRDRGEHMDSGEVLRRRGFAAYRAHPHEVEARASEAQAARLPLVVG